MSWSKEDVAAYQKMLNEESVVRRYIREAEEAEGSAEWYFDAESYQKATDWYHSSKFLYVQALIYTLGSLTGRTKDELDQEIADAIELDTPSFGA